MTSSALSRPGQRERLAVKVAEIDWRLAFALVCIASVGTLMLYSAAPLSWKPWAGPHLIRFSLCFFLMLALAMVDIRIWFYGAYPIYALAFILLCAVPIIGRESLGAKRWIHLGPLGLQPSEIMKIGLVLALARFYHGLSANDAKFSFKLLIPVALIGVPTLLVAKQPDLGTAILIMATGIAIMILAGLSWKILITGVIAALGIAPAFILFVMKDYQRARILTFLHPEADPSGSGYHILQAKIALGSGGLLGKGFGLGSQSQLNYLPEKHTDFIFATFAEEFGFAGCLTVLILYTITIAIALRVASISHSHFGRLSAAGVTMTFAFYVLINAAMVVGLAPVVGVPMPLMSYGGTEVLSVMISFGLVEAVRVHRYFEITSGRGSLL